MIYLPSSMKSFLCFLHGVLSSVMLCLTLAAIRADRLLALSIRLRYRPAYGNFEANIICRLCGGSSAVIAELQRAKRASEAPWVRKIGNLSTRENLVMTSRANVLGPYRLWGRGRGVSRYSSRSPIRETNECHLSLAVF